MLEGPWLELELGRPHDAIGWTIMGGGLRRLRRLAWRQLLPGEWDAGTDPGRWLADDLPRRNARPDAVFLTSRNLRAWRSATACDPLRSDLWARAVVTVGLSNALRAGDSPGALGDHVGTIHVALIVSQVLTCEARIEALALACEARTLAVVESGTRSSRSGLAASGTGTDCILAASPCGEKPERFVGKHTALGACIGAAVHDAVRDGVEAWNRERGTAGSRP